MQVISSSQNQIIKQIKSLKSRKGREDNGLFFVEGLRIVREALAERAPIQYLMLSEVFGATAEAEVLKTLLAEQDIRYYISTDKLFKEEADTENPQGVLAVIEIRQALLEEAQMQDAMLVMLDSVRDPGNMGTIIRTADAAGFTGVILTKGCVDAFNPKVLRSTMGSIFHIPVYQCGEPEAAIETIRSKGVRVYASHLEGSQNIYEAELTVPLALVVGSEAEGISSGTAARADRLIRIPMPGRAESLNASVAAGIMIFEAVRRNFSR